MENTNSTSFEVETKQHLSVTVRKAKTASGVWANSLTVNNLNALVDWFFYDNIVCKNNEGKIVATSSPTKDSKGIDKYHQFDPNVKKLQLYFKLKGYDQLPDSPGKQLVHLIWWRAKTLGNPIREPSKHISHLDKDKNVLSWDNGKCALIQEDPIINESRKYCHEFGWYLSLKKEDRPRCPHWENPCKGPFIAVIHASIE